MLEINETLIEQNRETLKNSNDYSYQQTKDEKLNYAAGYVAALQFCNNQINRILKNTELHHLEHFNVS